MISPEVPDDTLVPHVVGAAQEEELLCHVVWGLIGVTLDLGPAPLQALVSELAKPIPPQIEVRPRNSKIPARFRTFPIFSAYSMTLSLRPSQGLCWHHSRKMVLRAVPDLPLWKRSSSCRYI